MTKRINEADWMKFVRWDADFYKSLSDTDCVVCLTEQQVYLCGQIIQQLTWRTRWVGDTSGLVLDDISDNLEYRLSDKMTCNQISQLVQTITAMQLQLNELTNTVNNYVDPDPDPDPITDDTPFNEAVPVADMTNAGTTIDVCDDDGKGALYGAISTVVRYIHAANSDFLENMAQNTGNYAEQFQTLLGAFPPTDLMAADDTAKYLAFISNEMIEEYNATVDEDLLQQTICDLFCIGVANNCHTNMYDISNYFGAKIDPTFANFTATYWELVQYAFTGTFSTDLYFYYMCYFQLVSAAVQEAMGFDGIKPYELQLQAGQNSPDADWEIFCIECPPIYRLMEYDFRGGDMLGFTFDVAPSGSDCVGVTLGVLDGGNGIKGVACGSQYTLGLLKEFDPTWRIKQVKIYTYRENGIGNGTYDGSIFKMRPTPNSNTGSFNPIQGGFRPNGQDDRCNEPSVAPFYWDGANQLFVAASVSLDTDPQSAIWLEKIEILFEMLYAPIEGVATTDELC